MHPEILRELAAQRDSEMRARAHQARLARTASRASRASRAEEFVVHAIPDYVDGTFRESSADATGPAGRRAA